MMAILSGIYRKASWKTLWNSPSLNALARAPLQGCVYQATFYIRHAGVVFTATLWVLSPFDMLG